MKKPHKRWQLDNYTACHEALNSSAESSNASNETSITLSTIKYINHAAQLLALRIAAVISETGIREFNSKMNVPKNILQHWENGKSASVTRKNTVAADKFIGHNRFQIVKTPSL